MIAPHGRAPAWPLAVLAGLALILPATTMAADLFVPNSFPALVADRRAERVGDSLTIIINENNTATNSATTNSSKSTGLGGQFNSPTTNQSAQLGLSSEFAGSGQTGRTGRMVAQLSVVVDAVLPNGDLHVTGNQSLNINGERTRIKLSGRVRLADISSANCVYSTSLADAVIDYDGKGFVARSAQPGIVGRIFSWLGLT
jgi:flagellar L-ring protein precursor FlgH